jgi:hypothetical protein
MGDGRTVLEVLHDLEREMTDAGRDFDAACLCAAIVAVQEYEARAARASKAEAKERSEAR